MTVVPEPEEAPCDCVVCTGEATPAQLLQELVAAANGLLTSEDPVDAEMIGSTVLAIGAVGGEAATAAVVEGVIPELRARAEPQSLAMLRAIGALAEGALAEAVAAASQHLSAAGVPQPSWALELCEPVTVGECWDVSDDVGEGSILEASFSRARRGALSALYRR
ncbi:MAG: hypothetical protein ACRDRL_22680 [Sciscionella sp.]